MQSYLLYVWLSIPNDRFDLLPLVQCELICLVTQTDLLHLYLLDVSLVVVEPGCLKTTECLLDLPRAMLVYLKIPF